MKNFTLRLKAFTLHPKRTRNGCLLLLMLFSITSRSNNLFTPGITTPPASVTVCKGSTTSFTVVATGTGLTYAWQVSVNSGSTWTAISNNSQYSNATTAILTVTGITAGMSGYQYRCVVTDNVPSSVTTAAATLTVNGLTAPTVQTVNTSTSLCISGGGSVGASSSTSVTFQWQVSNDGGLTWTNTVDGTSYSGSSSTGTTGLLQFIANGPALAYGNLYHYIATDASGCSATSSLDTLFAYQPVISAPVSGTLVVCPSTATTINSTITSVAPISTYQWSLSGTNLSDNSTYTGTGSANLAINVTTALNGKPYRLTATDSKGCATSSGTVTLSVPSVTAASIPTNKYACAGSAGGTIAVTLTSTGTTPTRQWQTDNGTTAAGGSVVWSNIATTASLTIGTVTLTQDGWHYRSIVTSAGACNSITTNECVLHVGSSGYWLGVTDTNWHVATNWCGGVPTSTSNTDVVIPNWAPNMPTISPTTATAYWHSLTMQNNTTLRITGGSYPYNLDPSVYTLASVAYLADANQYILPATHASLIVGGSLNKLLQVNTAVTNTLTLGGSAKLVTGSYILDMKAGSNPIGGAAFGAASSWIVTGNGSAGAANTGLGGLTIEQLGSGSGAVLYPIGPTTSYYNPASITNTGTIDNFTLAVNDQPLPGSPVKSGVSNSWLLSEQTAGGSAVALQLQWNHSDEQSGYMHASSQIIRSNGSAVVQYTSVLPVSGSDPYASSGGSFSALSQFSVSSYLLTLPVQLLSFTAQREGLYNRVDWQVEAREQPSAYALERSADGMVFTEVARSAAINSRTQYSYNDKDPGNAVTYYRLRVLSVDNKTILYSLTVIITNQQGRVKMELRPSVTGNGETSLFVILPQKTTLNVTLTDAIGRVQLYKTVPLEKGEQTVPISVGFLARGIYYLRIAAGDGTVKTLSLVKQ